MTDPNQAADYTAANKTPAEIEADIRRTRAEMDETFDALGTRLHPDYIKEQAKDAIRSTARDAGSSMIDTLRDNPVPSLIAALSVGWLIAKGGKDSRDYDYDRAYSVPYDRYGRPLSGYDRYRADYYADPTARAAYAGTYAGGTYDSGSSLADQASGAAADAKAKAGQAAGKVQDAASDAADTVSREAQHLAQQAQRYGRRAENWLERQINQNPIGVGAAALAAGALVGLAVPGTDWEDEQLGQKSDELMRKAKSAAEEKLDQAKQVASEVADEAKKDAKDLASTAKKQADKKGLTDEPKAISGSTSGTSGSASGKSGAGGTSGSSMASGSASGMPGGTQTAKASDPRASSQQGQKGQKGGRNS